MAPKKSKRRGGATDDSEDDRSTLVAIPRAELDSIAAAGAKQAVDSMRADAQSWVREAASSAATSALDQFTAVLKPLVEANTEAIAELRSQSTEHRDKITSLQGVSDDHEGRLLALERSYASAPSSSSVAGSSFVGSLAAPGAACPYILRATSEVVVKLEDLANAAQASLNNIQADLGKFVSKKGPKTGTKFKLVFQKPDRGFTSGGEVASPFRNSLYHDGSWHAFVVTREDRLAVDVAIFPDRSSLDALAAAVAGDLLAYIGSLTAKADGNVRAMGCPSRSGTCITLGAYIRFCSVDVRPRTHSVKINVYEDAGGAAFLSGIKFSADEAERRAAAIKNSWQL